MNIWPGVNDDARVVVGVGREEAREDRELPEGGYENFLTAFNKETTRTARRFPLKWQLRDLYQIVKHCGDMEGCEVLPGIDILFLSQV